MHVVANLIFVDVCRLHCTSTGLREPVAIDVTNNTE